MDGLSLWVPKEPEDKELVQEVWNAVIESVYRHSDRIYVGPEFYQRMMREPYFGGSIVAKEPHIGNMKVIVVYPDKIVAGGS